MYYRQEMTKKDYVDKEEQELIESLETDNWEPAADLDGWKTLLAKAATNTLAKDQRMNIR